MAKCDVRTLTMTAAAGVLTRWAGSRVLWALWGVYSRRYKTAVPGCSLSAPTL